ncbi:retropepsin-like aspartic protease [Thalassotalea sp. G2M2-11]|uniref:retropepsin-like aspartic protease family protein n=1 Tax=Thalassotalea sp. G2M2-11 TaxID=2787627 RepID=UPI0019D0158F|nr:retropepsin-like aspartic protease [Thalassotalea sp. G2M2-11]
MSEPTDKNDQTLQLGKYFIWFAWLLTLGLLVFFFQELLEKQWNPNQDPNYRLTSTGKSEVVLMQNRQGHYVTQGYINDLPVTFLLDTGATNVSIPVHIAEQLQLKSMGSHIAQTANGNVRVYQTQIAQLNIGNLYLYNVSASINPGMKSDEILLGMSALKKVEFTQSGKKLILREQ